MQGEVHYLEITKAFFVLQAKAVIFFQEGIMKAKTLFISGVMVLAIM
jgi:hypothetical protein